jgi:hypothetical protein
MGLWLSVAFQLLALSSQRYSGIIETLSGCFSKSPDFGSILAARVDFFS